MKCVFDIALAFFDYCYGVRFIEACEVEEIGILVEFVEDCAGAEFCVGGGEDGDAIPWKFAGKGCATVVIF